MILWTIFICVHSFSVSGKKKKKKKSEARTCVWRCIGGGGGGGRKDDNRFLFSGFRVQNLGLILQTQRRTSSYFMNLVVDFNSFSGFKKISMTITWSYEIFYVLFVIRTKKDSEKFTKCYKGEPSKGISNTVNRFPSGGLAPKNPPPGLPWTHKGAPRPIRAPTPPPTPAH